MMKSPCAPASHGCWCVIGMHSVTFESAESFLQAYEPEQEGCLLVDIRMPGMSGLDLIEELERRKIALPAIVMTGHADARAMERLAGAPHRWSF